MAVALLFAAFHLPRWFPASGHGIGPALAGRLAGLTIAGLAFGSVCVLTANLWPVALLDATMNYRPLLVSVHVPADLHLVAAVVECAAAVSVVYLTVRILDPGGSTRRWTRQEAAS